MRIGTEPKQTAKQFSSYAQYEFECPCGFVWIDSQNNACPMCGETIEITAKPYEIAQPKNFNKK